MYFNEIVISFCVLLVYYLLPVIVATRQHRLTVPIALVNVFLGWTLVGWIVALAMATRPARGAR
ncbi:MAG: superinfection immunity protein [Dehalococcoidia bacterium]